MNEHFQTIYEQMTGVADHGYGAIDDEFENGPCGALYEKAFAARVRLSRLLDGNDSGENADALCIADAHEQMQRILCEKAYEYGLRDGLTAAKNT